MSQQLAAQNKEALADTQRQSINGLTQSVVMDDKLVILTPWKPLNMVTVEGDFVNHADGTSADLMIHTNLGVSGGIKDGTEQTINGGLIGLVRALRPGETTDKESYKSITALGEVIGETVLRNWFVNHGFTMKVPSYFGPSDRHGQDVSGIEYLRANFSSEEFESTTRMSSAGINDVDETDIGDDVRAVCKDLAKAKCKLTAKQAEQVGLGKKGKSYPILDIVEAVASTVVWVPYGTQTGEEFESSPMARLKALPP